MTTHRAKLAHKLLLIKKAPRKWSRDLERFWGELVSLHCTGKLNDGRQSELDALTAVRRLLHHPMPCSECKKMKSNELRHHWLRFQVSLVLNSPDVKLKRAQSSVFFDAPIHEWFELTYAQYLTVPRSVLQSMPVPWQKKLVTLLMEMDACVDWHPKEGRYWVQLKDDMGRYVFDKFMDYNRGRRRIPLNKEALACESVEK